MSNSHTADQPAPTPERADLPAVWDLVIQDAEAFRLLEGKPVNADLETLYGVILSVVFALGEIAGSKDVIADMRERDQIGRARYGTPLQPHNGRDPRVDGYQESLDLCVYFRQLRFEITGT